MMMTCSEQRAAHLPQQDVSLVHMRTQLYLEVVEVMPVPLLQLPQLHSLGAHLRAMQTCVAVCPKMRRTLVTVETSFLLISSCA